MNKKDKIRHLQEQLTDARDGLLQDEQLHRLENEVKSHDPKMWEDHIWSVSQQQDRGVFTEMAAMGKEQPDDGAIKRFHSRREMQNPVEAELEELVWSWFRRYVLTIGMMLLVLFAGLQFGQSGVSEANPRTQMESFLEWHSNETPELDHWLYDDF